MTLELKLQSFIVSGKLRALLSNGLFEYVIKLKDEKFIHGLGDTRFEAQKNATEEAIEYALDQGWITNTSEQFSFSTALELLKQGQKICRKGWNGKGMWLSYLDPYHNNQFSITEKDGAEGTFSPYIGMKTADNKYVPWLASQTDLLADDWMIAE